jgi:hypothetical protein
MERCTLNNGYTIMLATARTRFPANWRPLPSSLFLSIYFECHRVLSNFWYTAASRRRSPASRRRQPSCGESGCSRNPPRASVAPRHCKPNWAIRTRGKSAGHALPAVN